MFNMIMHISSTFTMHELTSIRGTNTGLRHDQICRGWGEFNPFSGASQPPKFSLTGLVNNTLLTTLWFYHKSSTGHDWAKTFCSYIVQTFAPRNWRPTAEPTAGMAQFHQILRRSPDHAVSDHKGDLEIDPFLDWKPVEIIANGSLYVVEFEDVQDQPSGRVQHGLKPVK